LVGIASISLFHYQEALKRKRKLGPWPPEGARTGKLVAQ
jgi:hypothetical protein